MDSTFNVYKRDLVAGQNPKGRMIIIKKADHFDFRLHPDEYNDHIVDFIDYFEHQRAESSAKAAHAR